MTIESLEAAIDHRFDRRELLTQALTHRSHGIPHNERLEFLGDSILNCVIAILLYRRFPDIKEGELSRLRASLVKQDALVEIAQGLSLGDYLLLGDGEIKSGGNRRPSMLADALEALIGAVYVDAGFDAAAKMIESFHQSLIANMDPDLDGKDPKTELQELLQGRRLALPSYGLRAAREMPTRKHSTSNAALPRFDISCSGTGSSRKAAEQDAAAKALKMIRAT